MNPASVKISDRFPRNAAIHPTSTIRRFRAIGDKKMSFARNKNNLVPRSENYQSIARKWVIFQPVRDLGRAKRSPTKRAYPRGTARGYAENVVRVLFACLSMSHLIVILVCRLNIHEISRGVSILGRFLPRFRGAEHLAECFTGCKRNKYICFWCTVSDTVPTGPRDAGPVQRCGHIAGHGKSSGKGDPIVSLIHHGNEQIIITAAEK